MTTISELPELEDIYNVIIPDEVSFFSLDEAIEVANLCIRLMHEFVKENPCVISDNDFDEMFDDNIESLVHATFDDGVLFTDDAEDELCEIIEHSKQMFFSMIIPPRQGIVGELEKRSLEQIGASIDMLNRKYQPQQRTPEWYEYRYNLITASNAYKAFESQSVRNSLIYDKCQPLDMSRTDATDVETKEIQIVNTNSAMHWGQKYEPLSVLLYEARFGTRVGEYGCLQHDKHKFLGASPDGLNIEPTSELYGRLLEIKNIVNREISGIPKKEYWIQMQLQMEVCDIGACDFLETKFTEYESFGAFSEDVDGSENYCVAKDGQSKGIIIHFYRSDGSPLYVYMPVDIVSKSAADAWCAATVQSYEALPGHIFMSYIYWKLDIWSCVLVLRNKMWFEDNVCELRELWDIVERERETGYAHRCPVRRQKKEVDVAAPAQVNGCLLKMFQAANQRQTQEQAQEQPKITVIKEKSECP